MYIVHGKVMFMGVLGSSVGSECEALCSGWEKKNGVKE